MSHPRPLWTDAKFDEWERVLWPEWCASPWFGKDAHPLFPAAVIAVAPAEFEDLERYLYVNRVGHLKTGKRRTNVKPTWMGYPVVPDAAVSAGNPVVRARAADPYLVSTCSTPSPSVS